MAFVSTVFGRPGPHVLAEPGDYAASQIENDSSVAGASVADAQNALAADTLTRAVLAADLGGTPAAPKVLKIHNRDVQDIDPADGDRLTWSAANNRWEPKAAPATTPSGYAIIKDINFQTQASTAGSAVSSEYTQAFDGITFKVRNPTYSAGLGEGPSQVSRNVNGSGFLLAGFGSSYMRSGASHSYLVTDVRTLPGYVAGREYGCVAVVDYAISQQNQLSMAYVGCFIPYYSNPTYSLFDDSGFGCGGIPRGDISLIDYKPVIAGPVVGESPIEDVPARTGSQFRPFLQSYAYAFGTLRRAPGYAEGIAGPYDGSAPVIESLMNVGGVQTLWAGSMDDLLWGVCWKGFAGFPYRHQQYCYVRRMIFYQSKE